MMPPSCSFLHYVAATFLLHLIPASSYVISEREDIYRDAQCPAFLLFETAAYLSDMNFELPCHCKPESTRFVVWYYQKKMGRKTRVLTDFNGTLQLKVDNVQTGYDIVFRFTIRMFSLIVFRAQKEDSGNYLCGSQEGHFFYGFNVDIQDSSNAYIAFHDKRGVPQPDLTNKYFVSFTTFWKWSVCDRCGVRGEQRRIGLCYVNSTYLKPRFHTVRSDVTSCGSEAVPAEFRKLLSARRPEIIIRSCTAPCYKKRRGFVGRFHNLIHRIKNLTDRLPFVPKAPIQFHTHAIGTRLSIACPQAKSEDAVAWDKEDGRKIYRLYRTQYLIGVNKSMRVHIDHGNHLVFRYVKFKDQAIYYCWLQGKLKAGFRLAVEKNPDKRRRLSSSESIFAIRVIGISYLLFTVIFLTVHCIKCCLC